MPDINRLRILATGSREWADIIAVAQALRWALSEYGAHLVRTDDNGRLLFVGSGERGARSRQRRGHAG
jgi:hypothetical protein